MNKEPATKPRDFGEEVNHLRKELENYARYLTAGNVSLAEDLVSDAIAALFLRSRQKIEEIVFLRQYLRAAIRNLYLMHLRKPENDTISLDFADEENNPLADFLSASDESVEDMVVNSVWLADALSRVDARAAEAFKLYYMDYEKLEDIAAHQSISIGTAHYRIKRVLKVLASIAKK